MISIYTAKSGPASLLSQEEEAKLGSHIKEMAEYGFIVIPELKLSGCLPTIQSFL